MVDDQEGDLLRRLLVMLALGVLVLAMPGCAAVLLAGGIAGAVHLTQRIDDRQRQQRVVRDQTRLVFEEGPRVVTDEYHTDLDYHD